MPFCKISLKAKKPIDSRYPKSLKTIGDHIRKKRLDLKLFQREVAKVIGVKGTSIWQWEDGYAVPESQNMPKIYEFLGYVPYSPNLPFHQKLKIWRESAGLSQRKLSKLLGMGGTAVTKWESGLWDVKDIKQGNMKKITNFFFKKREAGE